MDLRYRHFHEASIDMGIDLENVELGQNAAGVCVLAKDPQKPVKIRVPAELLLPRTLIDFETGTIKPEAAAPARVIEYWHLYLDLIFNEGAMTRRRDIERSIEAENLHRWSVEKDITLLNVFLRLHKTDADLRLLLSQSRTLVQGSRHVHMPYLDFANHRHPSLPLSLAADGLFVSGLTQGGEVFVSYGEKDALKLLNLYGFFQPCGLAFAAPLSLALKNGTTINIGNRLIERDRLPGDIEVPRLSKQGTVISASFCLLGRDGRAEAARENWTLAIENAAGLSDEDRQALRTLGPHIFSFTWQQLQDIRTRGEAVQNERLRALLVGAARDVMENAITRG